MVLVMVLIIPYNTMISQNLYSAMNNALLSMPSSPQLAKPLRHSLLHLSVLPAAAGPPTDRIREKPWEAPIKNMVI